MRSPRFLLPGGWLAGWIKPAAILGPENDALDDGAAARWRMVRDQLINDPDHRIGHTGVLKAMSRVPRHEFVPVAERDSAYDDMPLPIGHEQTISQPYIVALMTELLDPRPTDRVLEVGTGSGYQAAVLAGLVAEVYSVERVPALADRAAADLARLGYANVHVRHGDGHAGWPEAAPFDAIIVTCAPEAVPPALPAQLKEGGRMVIPVGPCGDQELVLLHKIHGVLKHRSVLPVRFVPMIAGNADPI